MSLFYSINENNMKKTNNNNANLNFIPFNIDSFNLSELKHIVYKYCHFESDITNNNLIQPWILHIIDCNGVEIREIPFYLPYNTNSPEKDSELNDYIFFIYDQIIDGCTWWLEEYSDYINSDINSNIFYIKINKRESM